MALGATGAVTCVGETMGQVVPSDGKRLDSAKTYAITPAGAESNVAISLARMGTETAWAGYVGDDPIGKRITRELEELGVGTSLVRAVRGGQTGVFMKDPIAAGSQVFYYRSGSAAAAMDSDYADEVLASNPRWIHLTGVTPSLSSTCAEMVQTLLNGAGRAGIPVSFDVNYRSVLWPDPHLAAEVILSVAVRADVVFVGLDEAQALWGVGAADDVRDLLPESTRLIVKDGAVECTAFRGRDRVVVRALPVDVVEPVGAGDAFAAGWIHAFLSGLADDACLRLGHLMAGIALRSRSDTGELHSDPAELERRAVEGTDWNEGERPSGGHETAPMAQKHTRRSHATL